MSGKPQYDEEAVVDAAVHVFWRHGYAATSINELTAATGLSRSSLYQRFQDKDGLFREALTKYTQRVLTRMSASHAETMRARLDALLREFLPRDARSKRPAGCLLARSCSEMTALTEAGREAALAGLAKQRAIIEAILVRAVSQEELAPDADIEGMAWHFLGVLQALLNLPQAGAATTSLHRMVDIAMSVWPVPLKRPRKSA